MPATGYAVWQGNVAINITAMKPAAAVKSKRKFAETVARLHSVSDIRSIGCPFLYHVTEASGVAYASQWNTTSSPTVALWSHGRTFIDLNVGTAVYTDSSRSVDNSLVSLKYVNHSVNHHYF